MSIIIIARASHSHGKQIAERVAQELQYECVSREVITLASEEYDIPEGSLLQTMRNAPSILDHFRHGKKKYVAYVQAALLEFAVKDNLVYHGIAGHFLLEGIPHVLRVLISATIEERVKILTDRENISESEALKILKKFDKDRRKAAMYFHDRDPWDVNMYDLSMVIGRITIDDAVKAIIDTVKLPRFQTTPEAQQILMNHRIAAKVKSDLMNFYGDVEITVDDGTVVVHIKRSLKQEEALIDEIREIVMAMEIPEIKDVRVNVIPVY